MPELGRRRRRGSGRGWVTILILLGFYFLTPYRTNILILGTDYLPHRDVISRTDTIMLATVNPLEPQVGILSIPRDLWVTIPGVGENRINTAYFYAEANERGRGPSAAVETVSKNFGITLSYFVVVNMDGVVRVIDSLGGVNIELESSLGGLPAGRHHLNGKEALAFARERYSGDDFSRMAQGQILIRATLRKLLNPLTWFRLPLAGFHVLNAIETNVPILIWPRLGLAVLRAGPEGIDGRVISREMVVPFQTFDGAQVLGPNWQLINPVLFELFGE